MYKDSINRRILEGARVEFAKSGYHRTVVSNIADRVGVGKGTVYRRFGDKKGLFTAIIRQGIQDLEADLRRSIQDTASPEENLEIMVNVFFGLYDHSRELIEIILTEGTQLIGIEQDELKAELDAVLQVIEWVFRQGIEQGRFRITDAGTLAFLMHRFLISVLEGAVFFNYRPKEAFGPLLLDIVLNGIRQEQVS